MTCEMSSTDFLFCAAQASGSREVGGDEAPATPVDRDGLCHCEFVGKRFPGADKYLGGVRSSSGAIYAIPGHAKRVLQIVGDDVRLVGPAFEGKYKWLRGVAARDGCVYAIPCHAERVLRIAFATRRSPAAALEIGPCNNPTPLPEDLVQRVDFVDVPEYYEAPNCARFDANDTEIPYRPRYLDDAQALAKARDPRFDAVRSRRLSPQVPDASYDVLLACHVLEHLPRPLVALANWLRVLRHGGLLVLVLPDPCARRRPVMSTGKTTCSVGERTLMDRYRLAHPGSHHVRDFWNRAPELVKPPPEHAMEMALSTYRLLELLHILKEPSLAGTGALALPQRAAIA